ncbi:sensor histidine kinase [Aeribacillus sp. FSL K6-2848]|uniref:sensor histidine kinase n=1 Tax=Aeribacillus sp. FSL K6-2848 TaxID=2954612 RepID=UPI0030F88EB8
MKRLPIIWKITGLIFIIVFLSLFFGGLFIVNEYLNQKEEELKQQSILAARTVAALPEVRNGLNGSLKDRQLIPSMIERLQIINGTEYIVVLDMDRTRLSHPVKSLIGTKSEGEDEGPAFAEHTYTSKANGETGTVIRAFVPVMNKEHKQVGVVIAAYKLPSLYELLANLKSQIFSISFLVLLLGGLGAWLLARHIKKQMFHLEPFEIAKMLVERTETFKAMHEGVIAIDKNERITIFNDRAKQMMGIEGDVIGKPIRDVISDTRLPEILVIDRPIYNKELQVRNLSILSNRIPIRVNNETVGAVAIFQDRTEIKKLAEELTGVKAFVHALRVQNHEHMNKLHTIAGLIQLGHKEKALEYVFKITEEQEELTNFLTEHIKDESISGLLLSKISRGKELGIKVVIDRNSHLERFPKNIDHNDLVIIIGNLIENAFDAFQESTDPDKEIFVSIDQNKEICTILVEDNGPGIDDSVLPNIFEKGFSTKNKQNHGIGLYLVKQIVDQANGHIQVESQKGMGTTFIITFDM